MVLKICWGGLLMDKKVELNLQYLPVKLNNGESFVHYQYRE